jgi:hypothetical protein
VSERAELGTSWTSVIVGWFVALGVTLVLSGIVGAIVGPSSLFWVVAPPPPEEAWRASSGYS